MSKTGIYQLKLQREIADKASFMNSTKWLYLFSIIKEINPSYLLTVKLLLDDKEREISLSNLENFKNQHYIEEYWGVFGLKEIEWLLIPSEVISERKNREEILSPKVKLQNIYALEKALQTGKQFEYKIEALRMKIYGYR